MRCGQDPCLTSPERWAHLSVALGLDDASGDADELCDGRNRRTTVSIGSVEAAGSQARAEAISRRHLRGSVIERPRPLRDRRLVNELQPSYPRPRVDLVRAIVVLDVEAGDEELHAAHPVSDEDDHHHNSDEPER